MKHLSKFSLVIFAILGAFGAISTTGKASTDSSARFYVVCYSGSHQWGGGYCAGGTDDLDTADKMAANHNRQFEGHSASRCAGSCPPCN